MCKFNKILLNILLGIMFLLLITMVSIFGVGMIISIINVVMAGGVLP